MATQVALSTSVRLLTPSTQTFQQHPSTMSDITPTPSPRRFSNTVSSTATDTTDPFTASNSSTINFSPLRNHALQRLSASLGAMERTALEQETSTNSLASWRTGSSEAYTEPNASATPRQHRSLADELEEVTVSFRSPFKQNPVDPDDTMSATEATAADDTEEYDASPQDPARLSTATNASAISQFSQDDVPLLEAEEQTFTLVRASQVFRPALSPIVEASRVNSLASLAPSTVGNTTLVEFPHPLHQSPTSSRSRSFSPYIESSGPPSHASDSPCVRLDELPAISITPPAIPARNPLRELRGSTTTRPRLSLDDFSPGPSRTTPLRQVQTPDDADVGDDEQQSSPVSPLDAQQPAALPTQESLSDLLLATNSYLSRSNTTRRQQFGQQLSNLLSTYGIHLTAEQLEATQSLNSQISLQSSIQATPLSKLRHGIHRFPTEQDCDNEEDWEDVSGDETPTGSRALTAPDASPGSIEEAFDELSNLFSGLKQVLTPMLDEQPESRASPRSHSNSPQGFAAGPSMLMSRPAVRRSLGGAAAPPATIDMRGVNRGGPTVHGVRKFSGGAARPSNGVATDRYPKLTRPVWDDENVTPSNSVGHMSQSTPKKKAQTPRGALMPPPAQPRSQANQQYANPMTDKGKGKAKAVELSLPARPATRRSQVPRKFIRQETRVLIREVSSSSLSLCESATGSEDNPEHRAKIGELEDSIRRVADNIKYVASTQGQYIDFEPILHVPGETVNDFGARVTQWMKHFESVMDWIEVLDPEDRHVGLEPRESVYVDTDEEFDEQGSDKENAPTPRAMKKLSTIAEESPSRIGSPSKTRGPGNTTTAGATTPSKIGRPSKVPTPAKKVTVPKNGERASGIATPVKEKHVAFARDADTPSSREKELYDMAPFHHKNSHKTLHAQSSRETLRAANSNKENRPPLSTETSMDSVIRHNDAAGAGASQSTLASQSSSVEPGPWGFGSTFNYDDAVAAGVAQKMKADEGNNVSAAAHYHAEGGKEKKSFRSRIPSLGLGLKKGGNLLRKKKSFHPDADAA